MAKKTHRENFRVVVEPRGVGDFGFAYIGGVVRTEREGETLCLQIAEGIKRYVGSVKSAVIQFDTVATCSFCGAKWTEVSDTYNGGCCDEDEANNPAEAA